jgi:hypothetical protein
MVRRIVHNDHYAGYVSFGDVVNTNPSNKYPIVWGQETHGKVVRERENRNHGGSPPATSVSGIVVCARCSWSMTYASKEWADYYRCNLHAQQKRYRDSCHPNHTRIEKIFTAVENALGAMADLDIVREVVRRSLPDRVVLEQRVGQLRSRIEKLEATRDRLTRLVAEGTVKPDAYRRSDNELLSEMEELESVLTDAENRLHAIPDVEEYVQRIESALELTKGDWHQSDAMRQALIRSGLRVYCEDGDVVGVRLVLDERTSASRFIQEILARMR